MLHARARLVMVMQGAGGDTPGDSFPALLMIPGYRSSEASLSTVDDETSNRTSKPPTPKAAH